MLAAVESGDAKELAELMRQDPGFNVNMEVDGLGWTLLYSACLDSERSAVIPLLLAHPDVDANVKDGDGWTPFYLACADGSTPCVRALLKDSRVNVNEPARMDILHSGMLLSMATLTSSSGGLRLKGR